MFLTFDTETTGLPKNFKADVSDSDNWPRLVQLAWQLNDETGKLISNNTLIVKPEGFTIPYNSEKVHGISTEKALKEGIDSNSSAATSTASFCLFAISIIICLSFSS